MCYDWIYRYHNRSLSSGRIVAAGSQPARFLAGNSPSEFDACESRLIFTQGTMNLGNLGSSARVIMAGDGPLSFSFNR